MTSFTQNCFLRAMNIDTLVSSLRDQYGNIVHPPISHVYPPTVPNRLIQPIFLIHIIGIYTNLYFQIIQLDKNIV